MNTYDIAIVGGGAAGMLCAVQLKRHRPALRIAVLERQTRVGRKLLSTGNGRCNLTNMNLAPAHYFDRADFVAPILTRYTPRVVLEVFESMGLYCSADEAGRVYPTSGQAASVLDALRLSMDEAGVEVLTGFEVKSLTLGFEVKSLTRGSEAKSLTLGSEAKSLTRGFELRSIDNQSLRAQQVVLASGGPAGRKLGGTDASHRLASSLGHEVTKCLPALVQLKTDPERVRALKGIRAACRLKLYAGNRLYGSEEGEILFTEYGLSGIASMALGKTAAQLGARGIGAELSLNFTPSDAQAAYKTLTQLRSAVPMRTLDDLLSGLVPKRLGQTLLKSVGLSPLSRTASTLDDDALTVLSQALTDWRLPVAGTKGFDDAQITAGGLSTRMFDPITLQSTRVPGLYAIGEALDVDGPCGGYNLHWAWASAMAAAQALV